VTVLETERLRLRPLRTADADAWVALHADARVNRFVGPYTRESALERLSGIERQWAERGHGLCAVEAKDGGVFLGRCGLQYWPRFDEVELGWTLHPDHWGHGYATEAARACRDWGFATLPDPYFTAMIHPGNTASLRVAARLGFTPLREDMLSGRRVVVHAVHRGALPGGG
jgi:RimJ/RimL family protein N-acetyltransferase